MRAARRRCGETRSTAKASSGFPNFNARVCHFGAAQLCGEILEEESDVAAAKLGEIEEEPLASPSPARPEKLKRSGGSGMQIEGVRGYMSPEFQATGVATQKSDVYAFRVVMLELLSGEEPLKFRYDKKSGEFVRTSVIDVARAAGDGGEGALRRWVDKRLKDSFPIEVAKRCGSEAFLPLFSLPSPSSLP
ncbi:probable receptor-like protein kinase At1g33260 [Arachis duranensis]|uniref:Probable receptor-like protein kinase At1g33260 n=1 Tax=Arachis duranensis TaxID=130453 RepID=A0A6P4CNJ6_ARADU|nr:probable receptor-like protein kinase At1g33260 [Arachis duranensis]